jgi:hypothetical protein
VGGGGLHITIRVKPGVCRNGLSLCESKAYTIGELKHLKF